MKKLILIVILLSTFILNLLAQDEKNTVKVNVLGAVFGAGSISYERKASPKASMQLAVGYLAFTLGDTNLKGFTLIPQYRYFPKANAMSGFYISPFLRYSNYTIKDDHIEDYPTENNYNSIGGGAVIGRQWIYKKGFTLDLYVGPGFNARTFTITDRQGKPEFNFKGGVNSFGIRTGLIIGFGF